MPTYQYACTACDERLEVVQKFTDDPLTVCDACGGKLRKVFSAVGIVFKGSGFYRTDSRNGSVPAGKSANGSSSSPSSGSDAGSSSSSEPSPASTSGDKKPSAATSSPAESKVA